MLPVQQLHRIVLLTVVILLSAGIVTAEDACVYKDSFGNLREVKSIRQVPKRFRNRASCRKTTKTRFIAPDEVDLDGAVRDISFKSAMGGVRLRWSRQIESDFGRTPKRAVIEALRASRRLISQKFFNSSLRDFETDWQIVFIDQEVSRMPIPRKLIDNCHPGWMLPPNRIYIVADRIKNNCRPGEKTKKVADRDLLEVLLHEIGHVVEYQLLNQRRYRTEDAAVGEGFATWFELASGDYSSISKHSVNLKNVENLARLSFRQFPDRYVFRGQADDYARMASYFLTIVKRGRYQAITELYEQRRQGMSFLQAVEQVLNWSPADLQRETLNYLDLS